VRQHVERRGHERKMRERLREVAQQAAGDRVVLLGDQPEIVGQPDETLEQGVRQIVESLNA